MDRNELVPILSDALDPASESVVRAREKTSELSPEIADAVFIHTISKPIEAVLSKSEPFKEGGFYVQNDNGYSIFRAKEASSALSRRVLRGETPEQAVGWLERIMASDQGNGIGVLALWGVQIASPLELGFGVSLLPFSSVPDSSTKRRFSQTRDPVAFPGLLNLQLSSPLKAALVCSHTVSPLLHPVEQGKPPVQTKPLKTQSLLDDARLALTLVGPSCPVHAGYWFQFDDPDLEDAVLGNAVMTPNQEVLPWGFSTDVNLDTDAAKRLVSAFFVSR